MFWKTLKKILPFIGIALFVYLLIRLDVTKVFQQIAESNKIYLLMACGVVLIFLFFQVLKWFVLARKQKIPLPFWKSVKIDFMGNFYGLVTPGKLGNAMRVAYLRKYTSTSKGMANFMIDKVLDVLSLFSLAIILGFFVLREQINLLIFNYLLFFFFVFIVLLLLLYKKERSKFFLRFVYKRLIPKKMKGKAKLAFDSFYESFPKKKDLISILALNLSAWVINYCAVYFVALSIGIEINFLYFIALYPIATLVAQIPITISGLGTRELTLISLFGLFGIEAVKVFSMSLISIFIMAVIPSIIAIPFILKERKDGI